ncbi:hypothetical protein BO221_26650 [Archangium sp. Cb G35]|uniref:(2Fe-2S) ferredoxin domain-containing protein n=1 Tax=Archangium sp. Cb G35 TaxID=1920190 RepID=UPI00093571EC|nr:(2Fe-2S) ferredoxin domain-containing protein [Archangium sp. Cb G35]OJT21404.1 hypothetical protein BO221_26650 [Archangium sp. Cb G35]
MSEPKEVQPRWEGLVFVCRKCMKRAGAEDVRSTLKEELGRGVRVVRSSCLKLCPKGRVTVVVGSGEGMRCLLVDPEEDADSLVRAVSRALGRPPE